MDAHSRTFFSWLAIIIGCVLFVTYYDTMVLNQFQIFTTEEEVPEYTGAVNSFIDIVYSYAQ